MTKLQFRVLYREFLFRMVDREVLSAHEGDANRLLGRFATILILLSLPFTILVLSIENGHMPREAVLISAWGMEHSLIATTMLVVGLFAVLSWDSTFPDRRDVLVLAPLPVRASTMFLAKVASLAVALSLAVITFNAGPGLTLPLALAPPSFSGLDMILMPDFYRTLVVYWITMFAAGAFVLCCVLAVQGLAAQLPRRLFLRLSAILQIATFCLFVGVYFLQPSLASAEALTAPENERLLVWLPSYWFLGLFQELNGSLNETARPTLVALAGHAWIGLGLVIAGAGLAFLFSYFRTLRKIVEQPDIVAGSRQLTWLPRFGTRIETAVTQFSIRTLLRSRQHRVLLSFYVGIGFAMIILFLKTPLAQKLSAATAGDPWHRVSLPLLASSFVMTCFWVLGIRVVFAIPLELRANWIFRFTQIREASEYFSASRRAMYVLALAPVWATSAVLFLSLWPWRPAVRHLAVLACVGVILTEVCVHGFHKIPFTCSYLPGKSNLHITFLLCLMLGLNLTYWSAEFERRALSDLRKYSCMLAILCFAAICVWWRASCARSDELEVKFEEELSPVIAGLGLHRDGILPVQPSPPKWTPKP
ncbi:MAG: hypothetical protein ACR2JB_06330 [Bryobacteraceae bacterium]